MASKYIGACELMKQNGYLVADILDLITSGKLAAYYHDGRKITNIHFQKEYEYRGDFISEYMLGDEIFKTPIVGGKVLDWLWKSRSDVYAFPFLDKDALRLGLSVHERQRIAKDTKFLAKDFDNLVPTNNTSISRQQAESGNVGKGLATRERKSYLIVIAALYAHIKKKSCETPTANVIEARGAAHDIATKVGEVAVEKQDESLSISENTVKKIIEEIKVEKIIEEIKELILR